MKTLHTILKLAIIALILLLASCSKDEPQVDESEVEIELTTADLLISGPWNMDAILAVGTDPLSDCGKKTTFHFVDENTLLVKTFYTNQDDNCVTNGTKSFDYTLSESDEILINVNDFIEIHKIEYISTTELIIKVVQADPVYTYNLIKL